MQTETMAVDLTDPAFWVHPGAHSALAEIRERAPVFQHDSAEYGRLWAVLSFQAACEVLAAPDRFGSAGGSLLGAARTGPGSTPAGSGQMMALTDPPRHRAFRAPVADRFSVRRALAAEPRIRDLTDAVVAKALAAGQIDFVSRVGSLVPLTVMCDQMGIPASDRDAVVGLCDRAFLGTCPEQRTAAHRRLVPYLFELAAERRARPRDDVVSALAVARVDGRLLPLEQVVANCDNLIVGGVQTVRHTSALAVAALIEHPAAWQELRHARVSFETAVEELLRWTSAGLHILRTARADTELAGRPIMAGDRVVIWTPAANRDAREFDQPQLLRLNRRPNRHIAFGLGPHYCIGAPLARVELRALLETLAREVLTFEPTGPAVPNGSIINFGLKEFPMRLHAAGKSARS